MKKDTTTNLTFYVAIYWFIFWLFNGADKFLNHSSFGPIIWYGKDRDWQFSVYLTNMKVPTEWVGSIIFFAGVWEIIVAVIFALFIVHYFLNYDIRQNIKLYTFGLKVSFITFVGFCAFDVVAGDRAELLEHSTYIGVVGVSYLVYYAEHILQSLKLTNHKLAYNASPNSLKPVNNANYGQYANTNIDQFDDSEILHTLRNYRKGE